MNVAEIVTDVLRKGLARDVLTAMRRDLAAARTLLYIGDNAGEIAFDRLLIEAIQREYPAIVITFAVKSGPAMNDATKADADAVGLAEMAALIETGAACLGVPMTDVSPAFAALYQRADMVIAKGHANFETLDEAPRPALYFLLTIKCASVAGILDARVGDSILHVMADI